MPTGRQADDTAIRETLGWQHRTSLRSALEQTLDYYSREISHYV